MPEPRYDIAHLGHVELLSPKIQESVAFFQDIFDMHIVAKNSISFYLRGWRDYEQYSLKLTKSSAAGIGHVTLRTTSQQALARCITAIEPSGKAIGWVPEDEGQGPAYQFFDPDGHVLELYAQ